VDLQTTLALVIQYQLHRFVTTFDELYNKAVTLNQSNQSIERFFRRPK